MRHALLTGEKSATYDSQCILVLDDEVVPRRILLSFSPQLSIASALKKRNTKRFVRTVLAIRNTEIHHHTNNIYLCTYCAYWRLYDRFLESWNHCRLNTVKAPNKMQPRWINTRITQATLERKISCQQAACSTKPQENSYRFLGKKLFTCRKIGMLSVFLSKYVLPRTRRIAQNLFAQESFSSTASGLRV